MFLTDVIHAMGVLGWVDELTSLMLCHGYGWEWLQVGERISPPQTCSFDGKARDALAVM